MPTIVRRHLTAIQTHRLLTALEKSPPVLRESDEVVAARLSAELDFQVSYTHIRTARKALNLPSGTQLLEKANREAAARKDAENSIKETIAMRVHNLSRRVAELENQLAALRVSLGG